MERVALHMVPAKDYKLAAKEITRADYGDTEDARVIKRFFAGHLDHVWNASEAATTCSGSLLSNPPNLKGSTRFGAATGKLRGEIQKEYQQTNVINFYVITDVDFDDEDWRWLEEADKDSAISITFVFQDDWLSEQSRRKLSQFKRIRRLPA